jgi:hypothetical protein
MKIIEILTFSPGVIEGQSLDPLSSDSIDRNTVQRVSNALTGPEFVIDPLGLQPGVDWPGASVRDTGTMPMPSPPIGRDTVGSVGAPTRNGAMQRGYAEPRRPIGFAVAR